ncbi:hypothetical protein POM88_025796 [Heracleum sosnowskyi]|uniref:Uncharacterized protein n=1 Tax=Heracleum sosnowskyi TaxID=360622 RepID=A0AAD8MN91_9APIA|nr:hypothetical protein POM88_025796 [Heracleum sosnowskyi]
MKGTEGYCDEDYIGLVCPPIDDYVLRDAFFFAKLIQQCSFEGFILRLAKAYDGYNIDFPTFLDFRGRVYRSGIFHFHQCGFARSLILFGGEIKQCSDRYKLQDKLRSSSHTEIDPIFNEWTTE